MKSCGNCAHKTCLTDLQNKKINYLYQIKTLAMVASSVVIYVIYAAAQFKCIICTVFSEICAETLKKVSNSNLDYKMKKENVTDVVPLPPPLTEQVHPPFRAEEVGTSVQNEAFAQEEFNPNPPTEKVSDCCKSCSIPNS